MTIWPVTVGGGWGGTGGGAMWPVYWYLIRDPFVLSARGNERAPYHRARAERGTNQDVP